MKEHLSTHNKGVNGKQGLHYGISQHIHLQEHIPSVRWGNATIYNAILNSLECLPGKHKKHYLIQIFSRDKHQLTLFQTI
jgi:hypothetical protein